MENLNKEPEMFINLMKNRIESESSKEKLETVSDDVWYIISARCWEKFVLSSKDKDEWLWLLDDSKIGIFFHTIIIYTENPKRELIFQKDTGEWNPAFLYQEAMEKVGPILSEIRKRNK